MVFLGLNIIDWLIVLAYLAGMLYIGRRLVQTVKNESDFYLAGRKLGKIYQFFMTFGNATDANSAATVTSEVYRQGAGGVWIAFQVLFLTPFLWFTNVWYRRARLVSMGDLFEDRFGSRSLAALFSCYCLALATVSIGFAYLAAGKTLQAILIKPKSSYTVSEQQRVHHFKEYNSLHSQYIRGALGESELKRYEVLSNLNTRGQLSGFISYLHGKLWVFYIIYGLTIGIYVICGGFKAAAAANVVQGLLIIVFSVILIPFGLSKLGGFSGLHASLPDYMFSLVGNVDTSEYTWYTITAFVFVGIFANNGNWGNMASGGSAKNEYAARFGLVSGCFAKRIIIIAWVVCGLIGASLYSGKLADPDQLWGTLTNGLLDTRRTGAYDHRHSGGQHVQHGLAIHQHLGAVCSKSLSSAVSEQG
jgi:solute:Na+ symporter, SSS family